MRKILLLIITFLVSYGGHAATEGDGPTGPRIEFDVEEYDYGILKENQKKTTYDFVFRNTGNSPLVVTRIITSGCKCISTSYTRKPVPPGGEGMVSVTYDPKKQQGIFYKAIQVFSNAPEGMHIVIIKGEVVEAAK